MKPDPSPQKSMPARVVACPACKGKSLYSTSNPYRPFCSERCRNADLGAWASESFRMPVETPPDNEAYGDPKLQ